LQVYLAVLRSSRAGLLRSLVAADISLPQTSSMAANGQRSPQSRKKQVASLSLKLRREIPFEHPLRIP